jgi:hypothetical protein
MAVVYVSAQCPWSAKLTEEMRRDGRTEPVRDVAQHAPPSTVRAVPSVVLGDGTVHTGEAAFQWLREQPPELTGYEVGYDGLAFMCLESNCEARSETFTWIGDGDGDGAGAAAPATPADPMMERLIKAREAEVPAPIIRRG